MSDWKNIYEVQPSDDQLCFIRVITWYGQIASANWNATNETFVIVDTTLEVPFYMVGRWKPKTPPAPPEDWPDLMLASYRELNPIQAVWFDANPADEAELLARLTVLEPDFGAETDAGFIYFMRNNGLLSGKTITKSGDILRWDVNGTIFNQNDMPNDFTSGLKYISATSTDGWSGITRWDLSSNNFEGGCCNFNFENNLLMYIQGNDFTLELPNFNMPNLQDIRANSMDFEAIEGFDFVTINLGVILISSNSFDEISVDGMLSALVTANKTTGSMAVYLNGGTNAPPSAAGLADKTTLEARGWTVEVN